MTIRLGTLGDLDALVAMGERFLCAVYAGLITPDGAVLRTLATNLLSGEASRVFVAEREGVVIGMLGMLLFQHPMSGLRTATEVMWWVDPAHRGCGLRLLKVGESWACEGGAVMLQMIAPSADTERLYERLGFAPVERTYQKRLSI